MACPAPPRQPRLAYASVSPSPRSFMLAPSLSPVPAGLCTQRAEQTDEGNRNTRLQAFTFCVPKDSTLRDTNPRTALRTLSRSREPRGRCLSPPAQAGRGRWWAISGHPCGLTANGAPRRCRQQTRGLETLRPTLTMVQSLGNLAGIIFCHPDELGTENRNQVGLQRNNMTHTARQV